MAKTSFQLLYVPTEITISTTDAILSSQRDATSKEQFRHA